MGTPGSVKPDYDICLSFAGEQRAYVEKVADALRRCGIRVFYDAYEQAYLWGKDLYSHLDYIYREAATFCVVFVSREYAAKSWTNHELKSAQARAVAKNEEYILPARFDDTDLPGLRPTIGYIDLTGITPDELAGLIADKLHLVVDPGRKNSGRSREATLLARGGLAQAFVHRQDLSGLGLRDLPPLHVPEGASAVTAAEFDVVSSVIETLFADAGSAASKLQRRLSLRTGGTLTDPDLLLTSDLVELLLGQKAYDFSAVDAAADRLLGRTGDTAVPLLPGLRAAVLLAQASTHLWHGRHEHVGSLLDEALAEAARDGLPALELEALSMMAFVDSYWSRMNRADDLVQRAYALRKQKNLDVPAVLELATALRSLIAGDLDGGARALQRILLPDVVGSDPGLAVAYGLAQASFLLARGQLSDVRLTLDEAGPRIPPLLAVQRDVMLADLDTSLGQSHAALRLLRSYRDSDFAALTAMPLARAHLALNDLRSAQDCARSALAAASPQIGRYTLVDALLCSARIAKLSDDPGRALEMLIRALEIARGEIVLPFISVTDAFADLLDRHPTVGAQWPVPRRRTPAKPAVEPAPAIPADLPNPLTQRELTILRFLATSMSTMEIADELCLSVNTVKTHMVSIYRKLPASRRREAVLRARELELI